MKLYLLMLFNIVVFFSAHASDLSVGGSGEFYTGASEYVANDGNCPSLLKNWVEDDFTDQSSFFFPFKSEAKTCQMVVKGYQDFLKETARKPAIANSSALGEFFSQKHKDQVHPSYQDRFLKDCKSLPPEKATAIQTRFYAASARIAAVNSPIIDEVSYYDSISPGVPSTLQGVDCTPMFPDNSKKCTEYKTQAQSCAVNKQKRFDDLIAKTKKNLIMIEDLLRAHRACKKAATGLSGRAYTAEEAARAKSCDTFLQVVEIKRNETPWIRGEIFKKAAIKNIPNLRNKFTTEYNFDDKSIEKAMASQIAANRKALNDTYNNNLENFRCMSTSVKSNGERCDFKKIRTDLSLLPPLDQREYASKNRSDGEAKSYLEAESCLIERGEDRAKTQAIIDGAGKGIALTVLTLGIGSVASGVRAVNAASKVGRSLSVANGALGAALTTEDLKHTYDSCSIETKLVSGLSSKSEITTENICSDPKSPLSQAREKESDCLVNALLSAPGVLPFVGAVPSLAKLARKPSAAAPEKAELNGFISNMSGRDNLRKQDLDFAGSLNKEDRITAAEGILGRSLSQKEKDAIIAAHEKGGPLSFNGAYTPEEIAEKRAIMKAAGFSERESETMLWKGITGYGRPEIQALAQKRATEFFGKPVSSAQADAILRDHEIMLTKKGDRMQNLTDAGFTPKQAQEIMDQKLTSAGTISSTHPTQVPVPPKATPAPAAVAKPTPPPTPPPVVQAPAVSQGLSPQQEAAEFKKRFGQDGQKLIEVSRDPKASVKQVEAALEEGMRKHGGYKPSEKADYIIDSFNDDVSQIYKLKSKLQDAKPGTAEYTNTQQAIQSYKARCKSWKALYTGVNYSSDNIIRHMDRQIGQACAD